MSVAGETEGLTCGPRGPRGEGDEGADKSNARSSAGNRDWAVGRRAPGKARAPPRPDSRGEKGRPGRGRGGGGRGRGALAPPPAPGRGAADKERAAWRPSQAGSPAEGRAIAAPTASVLHPGGGGSRAPLQAARRGCARVEVGSAWEALTRLSQRSDQQSASRREEGRGGGGKSPGPGDEGSRGNGDSPGGLGTLLPSMATRGGGLAT